MPRFIDQFLSPSYQGILCGERLEINLDPNDDRLMVDLEVLNILTGYLTRQQASLSVQEVDGHVYVELQPVSVSEPAHL